MHHLQSLIEMHKCNNNKLADQAVASGAFGGGREGVMQAEYQAGSDRNRAAITSRIITTRFWSSTTRQQDIANRFGLSKATQGLGSSNQD